MSIESDPRGALPSVDVLMRTLPMERLVLRHGRTRVLNAVRTELAHLRANWRTLPSRLTHDDIAAACEARISSALQSSMRRVINLTGTVIHTNLGRSVMPQCVVDAVAQAITNPVALEYKLDEGGRGERDDHIEGLLKRLSGAEAALAVNNNAAAVYLALNTLARGREVPVSRGELVEIGGAFRVPEIMRQSGVTLVEVGTTNRTHRRDYEAAIGAATAALMKVHKSNYRIEGFTSDVSEAELADVAHAHGLPLISDLGSGTLVDLREFGLPREPTPREMIAQGVDLVTFSGDKLLGGPQAGIVVGRKELIEQMRYNPMKRALRLDKMTLAALEAVLRLYEAPDRLCVELPVLRLLTRSADSIREQSERVLPALRAAMSRAFRVDAVESKSQIGSGSLPVDLLPSFALRVCAIGKHKYSAAAEIAAAFRILPVPVLGRVHDGAFLLDLRCLEDEDEFVRQLACLKLKDAG